MNVPDLQRVFKTNLSSYHDSFSYSHEVAFIPLFCQAGDETYNALERDIVLLHAYFGEAAVPGTRTRTVNILT